MRIRTFDGYLTIGRKRKSYEWDEKVKHEVDPWRVFDIDREKHEVGKRETRWAWTLVLPFFYILWRPRTWLDETLDKCAGFDHRTVRMYKNDFRDEQLEKQNKELRRGRD